MNTASNSVHAAGGVQGPARDIFGAFIVVPGTFVVIGQAIVLIPGVIVRLRVRGRNSCEQREVQASYETHMTGSSSG